MAIVRFPSLFVALFVSHRLSPQRSPVVSRGGGGGGRRLSIIRAPERAVPYESRDLTPTATVPVWGVDVSSRPPLSFPWSRGDCRATFGGSIMGMTSGGDGDGDCDGDGNQNGGRVISTPQAIEIEVEQKFALVATKGDASAVEARLRSLGFRPIGGPGGKERRLRFVDSYLDVPGPDWSLTRRDHWLRYREYLDDEDGKEDTMGSSGVRGSWELKRRPGYQDASTASSAPLPTSGTAVTAYEELVGDDAVDAALALLARLRNSTTGSASSPAVHLHDCAESDSINAVNERCGPGRGGAWGDTPGGSGSMATTAEQLPLPPGLPADCGLVPFARFETRRSAWSWVAAEEEEAPDDDGESVGEPGQGHPRDEYMGMRVDLDSTDFGHAVGEVETVVSDPSDVPRARDRIGRLVDEIVGSQQGEEGGGAEPTLGKLEVYMIRHRRDQYDACVRAGSSKHG